MNHLTWSAPNGDRFALTDPPPMAVRHSASRRGHKHNTGVFSFDFTSLYSTTS